MIKLLLVCLLAALVLSDHSAAQSAATAAIAKIEGKGTPKVRRKSGIESVAGVAQELFPGDRLTTDANSAVEVILADGSLVRIGLNSEYRFDSVERKRGIFTWVFSLAKGGLRALVEKNPEKNTVKFRVNTPVGTMGVRGTELVLEHDEKAGLTTVYTISGQVEFGPRECYLKKKCVEVKAGETASVGSTAESQLPTPKPFEAISLLLSSRFENAGEAGAGLDAAAKESMAARAFLFGDERATDSVAAKAAANQPVSADDAGKLLERASAALAAAQDKLIGRNEVQRKSTHQSIAEGSYSAKLKLAEKFGALRGGAANTPLSRESENLSARVVAKKMQVADVILNSEKMKKALAKQKPEQIDVGEKVESANSLIATARTVRPLTAAEAEAAVAKLNAGLADEILSEKRETLALVDTSPDPNCLLAFCEATAPKKSSEPTEILSTKIERSAGLCYETKQNCKREMIPCDLSKGKACQATFTEYKCTETKVQVSCSAK